MSLEEFRSKAGFPVDDLVRRIKSKLGVGKVRVMFDNPNSQAMSRYNGDVLEVHLPTLATILQQRPDLSKEAAIAKIKAQVVEELCHGVFHETNHDDRVVGCTVNNLKEYLSPSEVSEPYIQKKISKLQVASRPVGGMSV